jgi:hypothetical protein
LLVRSWREDSTEELRVVRLGAAHSPTGVGVSFLRPTHIDGVKYR